MYNVYKATAPNGKYYVGITNNIKRRLKEHRSSRYPFGCAARKYGLNNFVIEVLEVADVYEALDIEELLITGVEVSCRRCYNASAGGRFSDSLTESNPMHRADVLAVHPNLFSKENNPMNSPDSKSRMIKSQSLKPVKVLGETYYGVREAARSIGVSRQCLVHRLKSKTFSEYNYL